MPSTQVVPHPVIAVTGGDALAMKLAAVAALGGAVFGYAMAVASGVVTSVDVEFIEPLRLGETARNLLSGLTVSSALAGCVLGALLGGWLSGRVGRKSGLTLAAPLFLVSAIGSALPELGIGPIGEAGPTALWLFFVYRLVGGIAMGIVSTLSPLYICEIAPPATRGRLVTYFQLAVVCGFVSAYFINWLIASAGDQHWLHEIGWRWMLGSVAGPAVIFFLLMRAVPETPHGCLMRGDTGGAFAVLRQLHGEDEAVRMLEDIRGSLRTKDESLLAFGARVVMVGVMLAIFQQLMGINVVLFYTPVMFENMGASADSALLQTALIGALNMAFTFVAMYAVDSLGRKPLLIAGAIIMAAAMLSLGTLFMTGRAGLPAAIATSIYLGAFTFSWGPVTAVLLAEIFPTSIRSRAVGIAMAVQWLANFLVSSSFRILDGNSALNAVFHHGFTYLVYGCLCLLGAAFVVRFVPETKGKSLEQIQAMWR